MSVNNVGSAKYDGFLKAPLRNHFGNVFVHKQKGNFYMSINDYGPMQSISISEEFYKAFIKEFSKDLS